VGRLTQEKNLFSLLEALRGVSYSLSIVGSGEQREELEQFASENKVNVIFLGNVPNHEIPTILNKHDLFVLPSLWEGMPKTLLEAMSCGLPVIGTTINGIREVIEHGRNGILCDTDSGSIRKAIISLMKREELKKRVGINARKTIEERFSLDNLVDVDQLAFAILIVFSFMSIPGLDKAVSARKLATYKLMMRKQQRTLLV